MSVLERLGQVTIWHKVSVAFFFSLFWPWDRILNTDLYSCLWQILERLIKVFWNPLKTQIKNSSGSSLAVVLWQKCLSLFPNFPHIISCQIKNSQSSLSRFDFPYYCSILNFGFATAILQIFSLCCQWEVSRSSQTVTAKPSPSEECQLSGHFSSALFFCLLTPSCLAYIF